jgi:hypothetical protein
MYFFDSDAKLFQIIVHRTINTRYDTLSKTLKFFGYCWFVSHRKLHWTRWGKTWCVSLRNSSDQEGFFKGIIENGSEWRERAQFWEGNAMGRCLRLRWVLSLRFECALDFEGVGVSSLRQVFPHLSLCRQWGFLWDTHQWFFNFLVIFKARVISSVYCSILLLVAVTKHKTEEK